MRDNMRDNMRGMQSNVTLRCWWISATSQNDMKRIYAIDNFSQFGSPRKHFNRVVKTYLSKKNVQVAAIVDDDAFAESRPWFDPSANVNLFFYDGEHSEVDHYQAFASFHPMFDELFIAVIDDWNFPEARNGTLRALKDLKIENIYQQVLPSRFNGDLLQWWNGVGVFVLRKSSTLLCTRTT